MNDKLFELAFNKMNSTGKLSEGFKYIIHFIHLLKPSNSYCSGYDGSKIGG